MTRSDPTPSTGKRHPIFARVFARVGPAMDAQGALEHRRALLAGLAGRVLEVGAGSGLNFAHYPPAVTELLAVEPEPYLRALAETAAQQAAIPIRVVDGTADALPGPDAGMDAAVASLVLCSVPDQARALAGIPPSKQAALAWALTAEWMHAGSCSCTEPNREGCLGAAGARPVGGGQGPCQRPARRSTTGAKVSMSPSATTR